MDELRSDRLNEEAVWFFDCTFKEMVLLIEVSAVAGFFLGLLPIWVLTGQLMLGVSGLLVAGAIAFLPVLKKFSKLKRGKPAGYYQQYLKIKLARLGLFKNPYLMRSGVWSVVRFFK